MREQRVSTPDGRFWYVRRRWARRQLPGRRRRVYELGPAEREAVRVLPDSDDMADWYFRNFSSTPRAGSSSRSGWAGWWRSAGRC